MFKAGARRRVWFVRAIPAALGALAVGIGLTVSIAPASAAAGHSAFVCPKVALIGARGSGQPASSDHGLGPLIGRLSDDVHADLRRSGIGLTPIGVLGEYTADSTDELKPTTAEKAEFAVAPDVALAEWKRQNLDRFLASIDRGITSVISSVRAENAQCGSSPIVLAGYSQGAMAVHQAELQMTRSERASIAATVLVADGDRVSDTAADKLGSAPARSEGVRRYLRMIPDHDVPMPSSTVDVCNDHDFICDFTSGAVLHSEKDIGVHTDSYSNDLLSRAASWAAAKVLARLRRPTTPTAPAPAPAPTAPSGTYVTPRGPTAGPAGIAVTVTPPSCPAGDTVYTYSDGQQIGSINSSPATLAYVYTSPELGSSQYSAASALSVGSHQISFECETPTDAVVWTDPGFPIAITAPQLPTVIGGVSTDNDGNSIVSFISGAPSGSSPCPALGSTPYMMIGAAVWNPSLGGELPTIYAGPDPNDTSEDAVLTPSEAPPGQYQAQMNCWYDTFSSTEGDRYVFGQTPVTLSQ